MARLILEDGVWKVVDDLELTSLIEKYPVGSRRWQSEIVVVAGGMRYAIGPTGSATILPHLTGSGIFGGGKSLSTITGSHGTVAVGSASP
tara:strand:+ start:1743 stop:2012 length:270 start_codon:yes stop_codon:yes gene_type:complete